MVDQAHDLLYAFQLEMFGNVPSLQRWKLEDDGRWTCLRCGRRSTVASVAKRPCVACVRKAQEQIPAHLRAKVPTPGQLRQIVEVLAEGTVTAAAVAKRLGNRNVTREVVLAGFHVAGVLALARRVGRTRWEIAR